MKETIYRYTVVLWLLLAFFALSGCGAASLQEAGGDEFTKEISKTYPDLKNRLIGITEVKRVVDGDTFETKTGEKVRLIGVDTPETVKPGSPVEKFGKEASSYSKKQLTGKTVYLFKDTSEKDKYGRLLCYVFIQGEPQMYNELLIKEGYSNIMTVPPNVMYKDKFLKLEKEARQHKRGLWADSKK